MPNTQLLERLKTQGVLDWNIWRGTSHHKIKPNLAAAPLLGEDLSEVNLSEANLRGANLSVANLTKADLTRANLHGATLSAANLAGANLSKADLSRAALLRTKLVAADLSETDLYGADLSHACLKGANLSKADVSVANLSGANLSGASLSEANLSFTNLTKAKLSKADLSRARLEGANLSQANLSGANLEAAVLVDTNFQEAILTSCLVYGISAWQVVLAGAEQSNLVITRERHDEPVITVDNLEVAQFIYLLLHNEKIRGVIDTITSKAVLILGRFTPERKAVLDAMREELRRRNYLPILFDFEVPGSRDFTETISTLAHMVRFIIADLTEPSSLPKELEAIVPTLAVPVQPVMEGVTRPYAMFPDYWKYSWVLKVHRYESLEGLVAALGDKVIVPAEVVASVICQGCEYLTRACIAQIGRTPERHVHDSRRRGGFPAGDGVASGRGTSPLPPQSLRRQGTQAPIRTCWPRGRQAGCALQWWFSNGC